MGDTRKIFVSNIQIFVSNIQDRRVVDESHSARVFISCKPINDKQEAHIKLDLIVLLVLLLYPEPLRLQ